MENMIEIGRKVFDDEIDSLVRAKASLGLDFETAVRLIAQSNKVVVAGVGKSGIIGKKIAATLSSVGISSVFLHPVEALHGDIGMVQSGDVAILISKSGNTDELVKFIPYLKMRSANIIAIVGNKDSYLGRHSCAVLDGSVEKEACPFNLAPTTSTTVALAIGDALAVCTMKLKGVTLEDFSRLHPLGQIGRTVSLKVKDVMKKRDEIPAVYDNIDFKQALIDMSEKPTGCLSIVNNDDKLLGILTDGDIRRILNKYDDIRGVGIKDIMTIKPITIGEEAFLIEALGIMENRQSQINVLPVVDNENRLLGLVRLHDIVQGGS